MIRRIIPRIVKIYILYLYHIFTIIRHKNIRRQADNGIYYLMIGNYSHIQHLLPLYKIIGGTVIVTNYKNKSEAEKYHLKTLMLDNSDIDNLQLFDEKNIAKTINYLNKKSKIVITYDVIHFQSSHSFLDRTIFLSHGISLGKLNQFWSIWTRIDDVKKYRWIASSDKFQYDLLIKNGINENKFVYVTVARTSEVIRRVKMIHPIKNKRLKKLLNIKNNKPVITYLPSLWAQASIHDVGINICKKIDGNILMWQHPHTGKETIDEYRKIKNVIIARDYDVDLVDLCAISDILIVDPTTSVVTDAILSEKPIIFSYGAGEYNLSIPLPYKPIRDIISTQLRIDEFTANSINKIIFRAKNVGIDKKIYRKYLSNVIYNTNGDAVDRLANIIISKMESCSYTDES